MTQTNTGLKIILSSDNHADFEPLKAGSKQPHAMNDLGIEQFAKDFIPDEDNVVLCLAGDIGERMNGVTWALKVLDKFPKLEIIYVPGNHEFYGSNMKDLLHDMKLASAVNSRLHILDGYYQIYCVIKGVHFYGCTLWTDFYGGNNSYMSKAASEMNDYKAIRDGKDFKPITVGRIFQEHCEQRKWLFKTMERHKAERAVVVTHHQPYLNDGMTDYAYCSDLNKFLDELPVVPQYWFSGHTHRAEYHERQFTNGVITFVSNPVGYPHQLNTGFSKNCWFEI